MSYTNPSNYSIFGGSEMADKAREYLGDYWKPVLVVMLVLVILICYLSYKLNVANSSLAENFTNNYSGGAGNTRYTNSDSVFFNSAFTPRQGCGGQPYVSDDYQAVMGADLMAGIAADAAGTDDDTGSPDLNLVPTTDPTGATTGNPVTTSSFTGGLGNLRNRDLFSGGRKTIKGSTLSKFSNAKTERNLANMLHGNH